MRKPQKQEPSKLEAGIQRLKERISELRSTELYYRTEADRLQACVDLLQTSRSVKRI